MAKFDIINKSEEQSKQEKWKLSKKSTIISDKLTKKGNLFRGRVISIVGKNYKVQIKIDEQSKELYNKEIFLNDENKSNKNNREIILLCRRAGKIISFHSQSQLLATGDNVLVELCEKSNMLSTIVQVEPRNTYLSRNSIYGDKEDVIAANADKLLIIVAAADPFYNKRLIDRMIIAADMGGLDIAICVNKIDLMPLEFLQDDLKVYEKIGKKIFYISVNDKNNIEQVRNFINGSICIFSGPSGVGKSSLLNELYGQEIQKISQVSDSSGKGQHATSNASIIRINESTEIIDTPGIREFGLWGIEAEELALMFEDFDLFKEKCKYVNCTHIHEPNCAVLEAVETGKIDSERYHSYLNIFDSIKK